MTQDSDDGGSDSHLLRWLLIVAALIASVALGRKWAMGRTDAEFEARLRLADERRN